MFFKRGLARGQQQETAEQHNSKHKCARDRNVFTHLQRTKAVETLRVLKMKAAAVLPNIGAAVKISTGAVNHSVRFIKAAVKGPTSSSFSGFYFSPGTPRKEREKELSAFRSPAGVEWYRAPL